MRQFDFDQSFPVLQGRSRSPSLAVAVDVDRLVFPAAYWWLQSRR